MVQNTHAFLNFEPLNLVRCSLCKFVYLNPQPTEREIQQIYSKDYFLKWYSNEEKREFSKSFFRSLLEFLNFEKHTGYRVLDVGCGMGFFLEAAREWGWQAQGLEISQFAVDHCTKKLDFEIFHGHLESAGYQDNSFDIITAFDFLEHISGLPAFLSAVKKFLKPEGQFIALVPNYHNPMFQFDRWLSRVKKSELSNIPEHINYFTNSSLNELFQKNGFELELISSFGANDEKQSLRMRGSFTAAFRAIVNNVLYFIGNMTKRKETILAVAKKTEAHD